MRMFSTYGRPSPAMIVAVLALVFAMVGSAVAGTDGLSSKITKSKVKKIAKKQANKVLDGRQGDLSVAKAKEADHATTAGTASSAEHANSADIATDVQEVDWEPLTPDNGWAAYGNGTRDPAVAEGPAGVVYFRGAIERTSGTSDIPFDLEPELRPEGLIYLTASQADGATGRIFFDSDGEVHVEDDPDHADSGASFTSLEGLSYVVGD
jgi:hypothetical protein